jgi:hypothetical protein
LEATSCPFFGDFGALLDILAFVSVAATATGCSVLGTGFSVGVVGFFRSFGDLV